MSEAAGDWVGREVTDSPLMTLQEFKLLQRAEAAEARVKELEERLIATQNVLSRTTEKYCQLEEVARERHATIAELRALCREAADLLEYASGSPSVIIDRRRAAGEGK